MTRAPLYSLFLQGRRCCHCCCCCRCCCRVPAERWRLSSIQPRAAKVIFPLSGINFLLAGGEQRRWHRHGERERKKKKLTELLDFLLFLITYCSFLSAKKCTRYFLFWEKRRDAGGNRNHNFKGIYVFKNLKNTTQIISHFRYDLLLCPKHFSQKCEQRSVKSWGHLLFPLLKKGFFLNSFLT